MQLDSEFIMAVRRCADVMQCEFGSLLTAQVHDAVQCDLMLISRATMRCDAFCMEASRCDATRYKRNRFPMFADSNGHRQGHAAMLIISPLTQTLWLFGPCPPLGMPVCAWHGKHLSIPNRLDLNSTILDAAHLIKYVS